MIDLLSWLFPASGWRRQKMVSGIGLNLLWLNGLRRSLTLLCYLWLRNFTAASVIVLSDSPQSCLPIYPRICQLETSRPISRDCQFQLFTPKYPNSPFHTTLSDNVGANKSSYGTKCHKRSPASYEHSPASYERSPSCYRDGYWLHPTKTSYDGSFPKSSTFA